MKLHQIGSSSINLITAANGNHFLIGEQTYRHSLIVSPKLIEPWPPENFQSITKFHFELIAPHNAEIVIIGTGGSLKFPHPDVLMPLQDQKCGFEVMDTKAACRTYNVLVGDDRNVIACLLPDDA